MRLHNHHTREMQDRRRNLISHLKPGLKRGFASTGNLERTSAGKMASPSFRSSCAHNTRSDASGLERVGTSWFRTLDYCARSCSTSVFSRWLYIRGERVATTEANWERAGHLARSAGPTRQPTSYRSCLLSHSRVRPSNAALIRKGIFRLSV
jgi:hypothetical protein